MIPSYHIKSGVIDFEILKKTIEATPDLYGIYIHKKSMKKSKFTEFKNWFTDEGINVISSKDLEDL